MSRGRFITLEGGEGAGKSTQAKLLVEALQASGVEAVATREPGGAPAAEALRAVLLDRAGPDLLPLTQMLLHFAARAEHLHATVRPALRRGAWVVSDRFADSTLAYQCCAQGVARSLYGTLRRHVVGGDTPDLTIVLDIPVAVGLLRVGDRGEAGTRYDASPPEFHERVRTAFLEIARSEPDRCAIVDAAAAPDEVQAAIRRIVAARLHLRLEDMA